MQQMSAALCRAFGFLLRGAGFFVSEQPTPFVSEPGARPDFLITPTRGSSTRYVLDVAVTHGDPDAYAVRKRARYGALSEEAGMKFVPLVANTSGKWAVETTEFVTSVARAWCWRRGLHPSRAVPAAFAMLARALANDVASLLVAFAAPDLDSTGAVVTDRGSE